MPEQLLSDLAVIIWRQSWQLVVLIALVWPVAELSQRRYPRFAFVLWLLVAVKSLIPLHLSIPLSKSSELLAGIQTMIKLPGIEVGLDPLIGLDFKQVLILVWAMVLMLMIIRLIGNELRFRRTLHPLENLNIQEFDRLVQYFRVKRPVKILVGHSISSPLTLGFRNPIILIPETMKNSGSTSLRSVIAHEMAHVQRRDIITISLQLVLNMLFWFHPFMRIVNQQLNLNRERICDEMAVAALSMDHRQYGREILSHLELVIKPQSGITISGGFNYSHAKSRLDKCLAIGC